MEAFKAAFDLIESSSDYTTNMDIAKSLIDSIRLQQDKPMRLRLASMMSHEVQDKFFDYEAHGFESKEYDNFNAKRSALQLLTENEDVEKVYKRWAKAILYPKQGGIIDLYNSLYQRGLDLEMTPRIIEEIGHEGDEFEGRDVDTNSVIRKFTGDLLKLNPPRLPTLEKMEEYREKTGRFLPFYMVRKAGGETISIQFPIEYVGEAAKLLEQFRKGEVSREDVFNRASDMAVAFLEQLNPEQREDFLNPNINLEIRFATSRDKSVVGTTNALGEKNLYPQSSKEAA